MCRVVLLNTFNLITWKAEIGRSQGVRSQHGLQSEYQDRLDHPTVRPYLGKPTKQKEASCDAIGLLALYLGVKGRNTRSSRSPSVTL